MLVQLLKYDDFFSIPSQVAQHHKIFLKDFRNQASQQRCQSHQLVIHSDIAFFFYLGFFQEHSRFTGQQGKGEGIYLTPLYHFHPLHRHLDISRAITAESYCSYCSRTDTGPVVWRLSLLLKACSRRVGDSRRWGSLTMAQARNKAKCLSSVNHTTKAVHHHHNHQSSPLHIASSQARTRNLWCPSASYGKLRTNH